MMVCQSVMRTNHRKKEMVVGSAVLYLSKRNGQKVPFQSVESVSKKWYNEAHKECEAL